ncbi:MAG: hypothetical protein HYZ94_02395, partial [Candidatus Omnitrophica bacterium]|nr:hypothetical protein [Candidatus Omnitrophota bacterium]
MRMFLTGAFRVGLLAVMALTARFAWAETLEIVTYYPAPGSNSNDLYGRSLRVGTAYQNTPPPADGRALIFDRLGIGTAQPDRP